MAGFLRLAVALVVVLAVAGCGSTHGWRRPSAKERATITRDIRWAWRVTDAFEMARKRKLHPFVSDIRISRTDRLFARASVASKNAAGHQLIETSAVALMQADGRWLIVIGPGTDFASVCQGPAPQPILDLFCR